MHLWSINLNALVFPEEITLLWYQLVVVIEKPVANPKTEDGLS
jgi:hypothetical protein